MHTMSLIECASGTLVTKHDKLFYLYLLQLLLVGGIHLLKAILQLPITIKEGLAQLSRQMKIYAKHKGQRRNNCNQ